MAHYRNFQDYETVTGGCIRCKISSKHKNIKLRWFASNINSKLLRTGCPIPHGINLKLVYFEEWKYLTHNLYIFIHSFRFHFIYLGTVASSVLERTAFQGGGGAVA